MASLFDWSPTAGSNTTCDGINCASGMPVGNTDNLFRSIMAIIRQTFSSTLQNFLSGASALGISSGGTGATTKEDARTALGLGNAATKTVGSGNGLDADTVDGIHASALVAKDAVLCAGVVTVSGTTPTLRSGKSVSSVSRSGLGRYIVTPSITLPSYYIVIPNGDEDASGSYQMSAQAYSRGTGSFSLSFTHISSTPDPRDPVTFDFLVIDPSKL